MTPRVRSESRRQLVQRAACAAVWWPVVLPTVSQPGVWSRGLFGAGQGTAGLSCLQQRTPAVHLQDVCVLLTVSEPEPGINEFLSHSAAGCGFESDERGSRRLRGGGRSFLSVHRCFLLCLCPKIQLRPPLQCLAKVQEAFVRVEAALTSGNCGQLAQDFGCCQIPQNPHDQVWFLYNN